MVISGGGLGCPVSPSDSCRAHLVTQAYETELPSKSVRAFLPCPCPSFVPRPQLLCTAHSSPGAVGRCRSSRRCVCSRFLWLFRPFPGTPCSGKLVFLSFQIVFLCHSDRVVFSDTGSLERIHHLGCLGTSCECDCCVYPVGLDAFARFQLL